MTHQMISGILLLNKPLYLSSNAALQKVKRLFNAKKAGHTGNLDPLATGMLPICFNEATKFSQFLLESDKAYLVTVKLGERTTTGDGEGEVVECQSAAHVRQDHLQVVMQQMTGTIQQIPPMYSAIKYQGQALYTLARKGIEVERTPRDVTIHHFKLLEFTHDEFICEVKCSKGTYIRTLIEDCAKQLNTVAYVKALHRHYVSPYAQMTMYTLDQLEQFKMQQGDEGLQSLLLPMMTMMHAYPEVKLSETLAYYFRMGQAVRISHQAIEMTQRARVITEYGHFLGVGKIASDGLLHPERLLADSTI